MRIFIEEGEGVGQFGIIDEYFVTTKQINVLRETDGKPGWDHVVHNLSNTIRWSNYI